MRRQRRLLDPPPDDIQLALERLGVDALFVADQDLLDLGPGRVGLLAQHGHIDRNVPPAIDVMPHPQHFGFHDGPAPLLRAKVGARQKHLPHGHQLVHVGLMPGAPDHVIEEPRRDLHMDARPVAGLAIGIDSAAVPHGLQRRNPAFHHPAARLARNGDYQPHAAR